MGWLFVGAGAAREALALRAEELALRDRIVHIHGPVSASAARGILQLADVGLSSFRAVPAMEANSSNKFFDYLASGLPIVMNYGGWQYDLIQAHRIGIRVVPNSPGSVDDVIDFLASKSRLGMRPVARAVADHFRPPRSW